MREFLAHARRDGEWRYPGTKSLKGIRIENTVYVLYVESTFQIATKQQIFFFISALIEVAINSIANKS